MKNFINGFAGVIAAFVVIGATVKIYEAVDEHRAASEEVNDRLLSLAHAQAEQNHKLDMILDSH